MAIVADLCLQEEERCRYMGFVLGGIAAGVLGEVSKTRVKIFLKETFML